MNDFIKRSVRHALSSVALLLLLLVAGAPAAHAQIIFDVQLSERGREAVTDPDRMNAKMLLGLLAEEGRHSYEGEAPVMAAKDLVFIVGEHGEIRQRIESKPFKLEPGVHRVGEFFSSRELLAPLEDALMPHDGVFVPLECPLYSPVSSSSFDSEKRFPDTLFEEMDLKEGQIGLVIALVPADEELRKEAKSRPMGLVLGPVR